MKKAFKWLFKCGGAGCVALIIACFFSFFYYNTGRHSINPNGATDFLWEGNKFFCQMREGFSFGMTDDDGFNNAYPGATSSSDILVIGSSHMEAAQVRQNQNAVYLLNKYLDEAESGLKAYNIGLSSHNFYRCAKNFDAALNTYSPSYVVIETDNIPYNEELSLSVLDGGLEEVASYEGFLYDIQMFPLSKLLVQQFREYQDGGIGVNGSNGFDELKEMFRSWFKSKEVINDHSAMTGTESKEVKKQGVFEAESIRMLEEIAAKASEHNAKVIIVYHQPLWLRSDGTINTAIYGYEREDFRKVCESVGITLIDMNERFTKEYNESSILPHGFSNSYVGEGHLNAQGHRMIAEELYKVISEMQGAEK